MLKKILLLSIFVTLNSFSQKRSEIQELIWGKNDIYKDVIAVPEKWKNESAVIIYKYESYYYRKGWALNTITTTRRRIKLQDAAAVKEFSEFSFKKEVTISTAKPNGLINHVGVKIIKPSGKIVEIDIDKEIKTEDKKSKLAIPSLEIGDIIDYYIYNYDGFFAGQQIGFAPIETTLGDVYPTMDYKFELATDDDFFVNFNTYNGAPELKELVADKKGEKKYELIAKDIEKNEFPRWFYPLVELPCYKLQIFFAKSGKFENRAEGFLSESEKIVKKTVSKDDIFKYFEKKFSPSGDIDFETKFLRDKNFANDEEKVREVYYFIRHQYLTQYIEAQVISQAKIFYAFNYYKDPIFFSTEKEFIQHFMYFLKRNNIDYDVIAGTTRENGPIEDLLIQKNVSVLLRVNTEKPFFLEFFTPFSSSGQFNYNLENTKAFVLQVSKGKKIVDAEPILLPASTANDNKSSNSIKIKFNEDLSGLKVNRLCSFIGHFKESEQADKLNFYDYVSEDYQKYATKRPIDLVNVKKDRARYQIELDALIEKSKLEEKEKMKKSISEEFGFEIENNSFEVKSSGRFGKNTPFIYVEDFEIKNNLIKKAGENYIVELGKMITSQVEIDKKEKDRKNNVYLPFPRLFENEIIFEIPSGYSVSGIEKFNKSIINETGEFVSKASIDGNKVIVKTSKKYNNYFEPNKNWSKMILFLDAAYQFTQEKLLLKKI